MHAHFHSARRARLLSTPMLTLQTMTMLSTPLRMPAARLQQATKGHELSNEFIITAAAGIAIYATCT